MISQGFLREADVRMVEKGLKIACTRFKKVVIWEIGVRDGHSSRGMIDFVEKQEREVELYGFDNNRDLTVLNPHDKAKLFIGDSAEMDFVEIAEKHGRPNFVFIDGCHCVNHAMMDFLNVAPLVVNLGLVEFHDTCPYATGIHYQGHGPDVPRFRINVRTALHKMGLLPTQLLDTESGYATQRKDWFMVDEAWDVVEKVANNNWGGVSIFEKRSHEEIPDFIKMKEEPVWYPK